VDQQHDAGFAEGAEGMAFVQGNRGEAVGPFGWTCAAVVFLAIQAQAAADAFGGLLQ